MFKYIYCNVILLLSITVIPEVLVSQTSASYHRFINSDLNMIDWEVQDVAGNRTHTFHTYYGVLNESNVNRRTYAQIRNFNTRVNVYEALIDEILAQDELNPLYILMDRVSNIALSSLVDKRNALKMLYPMIGQTGDLYPIINRSLELGYDAPVSASLDVLTFGINQLQHAGHLQHLGDAVAVLEGLGYGLSALSLLDQTRQIAVAYTVFMAMDLDLYRMRLEELEQIATIQDPAFWSALHNIRSRLDRISTSYWRGMYQFGVDHAEEIIEYIIDGGLFALGSMKTLLASKASAYLPTVGAVMFTYGQFKMVKGHWESLALGTLAGTLYKDIEGRSDELQDYLGYIYLRERNLAFRNWTTGLFSFLNLRGWNEVLDYFDQSVTNYKQAWMGDLLDNFMRYGALPKITVERELELNICEHWSVSNSGGVEGTMDRWDISMLPEGALLDIRYDMKQIPDRIIMEYPVGRERLDTGWRGSVSYESPRYPGGIVGPGIGQELDVFRKEGDNYFIVKVFGVDSNTIWEYQVRCRKID